MERGLITPNLSQLVEFVGMPGSGKSTISHAFAEALRESGRDVWEPVWDNFRLLSDRNRRLSKVRIAARQVLTLRRQTFADLGAILGSSQSRPAAYPSTALNWFYISGLCRVAERRPGVSVFDQGVLQAVWSVVYGSDSLDESSIDVWAARAGESPPPGSVAAFVDADEPTIRKRLAMRTAGRGRIDDALAGPDSQLDLALEKGFAALEFVEQAAGCLKQAGRLQIVRLDSTVSAPESLALDLVRALSRDGLC